MRVIEILGPGCPRCEKTTAEIRAVVDRAGIDVEIRHVTDPFEIVARGALFSIPVVLIEGVLVSRGRAPSRREIEQWPDVGSGSAPSRHEPRAARPARCWWFADLMHGSVNAQVAQA